MNKLLQRIANRMKKMCIGFATDWTDEHPNSPPRCINCNSLLNDLSKLGYPSGDNIPTHHCPKCGLYQYMRDGELYGELYGHPK